MKTISIDAETRDGRGKGVARQLRRDGRVPGVLYGQGKNIPLSVSRRDLQSALAEAQGENVLFEVKVSGAAPLKSILREAQRDVLSRSITHLDFQHIDLSKKIDVSIAVQLVGEPEGVRTFGGILEHSTREVEVLCLPQNIPSHFEVDVSALLVGESIHVSELPAGDYEFLEEPTRVIAQVAAPTVEKVTAEEEAAAEGEAAEEGAEGAPADAKPAEGEAAAESSGEEKKS